MILMNQPTVQEGHIPTRKQAPRHSICRREERRINQHAFPNRPVMNSNTSYAAQFLGKLQVLEKAIRTAHVQQSHDTTVIARFKSRRHS
jgi:hypothetical protein